MGRHLTRELRSFARELRRNQTDPERLMWRLLRNRRQYPFPPFVLDFYCHELKLAIELDGGQHNEPRGRKQDARRDAFLAQEDIRVVRFWNNDVLGKTDAVVERIYLAVMECLVLRSEDARRSAR